MNEGIRVRHLRLAFFVVPVLFLLTLGLSLASQQAAAGEGEPLSLRFREGQVLKYSYSESLTYSPPTKFTGVTGYELQVKVDFNLKVARVTSDQTATARFNFERIAVTKDGTPICDLSVFPKQVEGISVAIKANGETTWYKNVYLTVNKGGKLEFRVGTGGGTIATGTMTAAGPEKNQLEANLDEGEGVIKVGLPPIRTLETPEHGKLAEYKVDLTPRKIFDLLLLPTIALSEGQTFSSSVKYLANQKLTFRGQTDDGGYQGSLVELEVTPFTDKPDAGATGIQPSVTGNLSYMIDSLSKMIRAHGTLKSEIVVPEIGAQLGTSRMELVIRK